MSVILSKIIMWVSWIVFALATALTGVFLTKDLHGLNSFSRSIGVFEIGIFSFPTLICGALRVWLFRIETPWLMLLPYLLGLFFSLQAATCGIFLVPEFLAIFQTLSA